MSSQTHDHHDAVVHFTSCLFVGIAHNPLHPRMADRVKEVALEEAERIKALTTDAVKSQAYLYPLKASLVELKIGCALC
jgi:hypothetical protein